MFEFEVISDCESDKSSDPFSHYKLGIGLLMAAREKDFGGFFYGEFLCVGSGDLNF